MSVSTLRPGLLVSLKSSVSGNVKYSKKTLVEDHVTEKGSKEAEWQTHRVIDDPAEFEAAGKVRAEARRIIGAICTQTAFGLLCPEDKEKELIAAIADARKSVEDFNGKAAITRVEVYTLIGRIAADDVEAVKAINSEVRDLMAEMEKAIKNCDPKAMREAASKARAMGAMLTEDAREQVRVAVDAARGAATRLNRLGEQAAQELNRREILNIRQARTAFLDIEGDAEVKVKAPRTRARAVDATPEETPPVEVKKPRAARRATEVQP